MKGYFRFVNAFKFICALGTVVATLPTTDAAAYCPPDIASGVTFSISAGKAITNTGDCTIMSGGALINSGMLENKGNLWDYGYLTNQNGATLDNNGAGSDLYNQNGAFLTNANSAQLINQDGATLTNTTDASIDNTSVFINSGVGTNLYNQNDADLTNRRSAQLINQDGATLTNDGDLSFLGIMDMATLINKGTDTILYNLNYGKVGIQNDNGLLNQDGATIINRNGGSIVLGRQHDNQNGGELINEGAGTNLYNDSGSILYAGGQSTQIINRSGATITNSGIHTHLYLLEGAGLINNGVGSNIYNQNGATLTGYNESVINNQNGATLTNSSTIENSGLINNSATFIVTSTGTVKEYYSYYGIYGVFNQTAGLLTVDGVMTQSAVNLFGGTLNGTGTINGNVNVDGAIVDPGHSPGTLTVNGDLTLTSGLLNFDVGGFEEGQHDLLVINGKTNFLAGTIMFNFINDFLPTKDEYFDFLYADTITGFDNLKFEYSELRNGFHFDVDLITGNTLRFTATKDGKDPVPEPATVLLFGAGLIGLAAVGRRKRN